MADLDALVQAALANLVQQGGAPTETALYDRLAGDIQRQSGNAAQQAMENTFGRGLGLSTISANILGDVERARTEALAKARNDAFLGAQQAQLSALGQAASVAQNQLNRQQQAGQFGEQMKLAKRGQDISQTAANRQLLAQGLGLGVGGLAQVAGKTFGPEITRGLRGLAGLGGPNEAISPMGGREVMASVPGLPDLTGIGGMAPELSQSAYNFSIPDLSTGTSFSMPDLSGLSGLNPADYSFDMSGLDLSWLNDLYPTTGASDLSWANMYV